MLSKHRNEKGITLVELLAVFAISGVVVMSIIGVHIFTQKQFQTQSDDANHLTDITIAMKEITKDVRTLELIIPESSTEVHEKIEFVDGADYKVYELVDDVLYKNNHPYIYDIQTFKIEFEDKDYEAITIEIRSVTGQQLETTLVVR